MAKDSLNVSLRERFFNEIDPRRKQELKDSQFIQEDPRAIANLPEDAIHTIWQKDKVYENSYDDSGVYAFPRRNHGR